MGMINSNTVYVVFNPKPIVQSLPGTPVIQYIPSGYYLVPYPLASDVIKFSGGYLECGFVLEALTNYNPN